MANKGIAHAPFQLSPEEQACVQKFLTKTPAGLHLHQEVGAYSPRQSPKPVFANCAGEIMNSKRGKLSCTESAAREKESKEDPSVPSIDNNDM